MSNENTTCPGYSDLQAFVRTHLRTLALDMRQPQDLPIPAGSRLHELAQMCIAAGVSVGPTSFAAGLVSEAVFAAFVAQPAAATAAQPPSSEQIDALIRKHTPTDDQGGYCVNRGDMAVFAVELLALAGIGPQGASHG